MYYSLEKKVANLRYEKRLDGLRFIAIFMVLLEHFAMYIGRPISAGFYGVNLFFVLSGFLITSILLNDGEKFKKAYFNFIGRRSLRIFPIYFICLIILCIINAPFIFDRLIFLATYTYNYKLAALNFPKDPYSPFWSLSVEEQFYVFFPFLVLVMRKRTQVLLILCIFFVLIAFLQLFFNFFLLAKYDYVSLLTNMGPLCLGAIGAIVKNNKNLLYLLSDKRIEILVILGILTCNVFLPFNFVIIICGILNLFLVLKAYNSGFKISVFDNFLTNSNVVFIGRISYGIYLFHNLIGYYITTYLFDPVWNKIPFNKLGFFGKVQYNTWIIKFPLYSSISIALAYLSYRFIESYFLGLKDKWFSKKSRDNELQKKFDGVHSFISNDSERL